MPARVLISAGEASGDLYAAALVRALRRHDPGLRFFGCAGPRMRAEGVEPTVDASSLAVVGLVEVVGHIPRIHREYRKLIAAAERERPDLAILTDSPDFHLRLAKHLKRLQIPVVYFIAPQVWAWRKGRLKILRERVQRLLCIFPFERKFFAEQRIPTSYIGHPLTQLIRPSASRAELRERFGIPEQALLIALLPGSRKGEIRRHLPYLRDAAELLRDRVTGSELRFVLALPPGASFRERFSSPSIQVLEGHTWDVLACSDLALAASGTVTVEACILNTPMVTFYRVNALSWLLGKLLVRVPFFSMVNLIAGRRVVPELIQGDMTADRLAREAERLLTDEASRRRMHDDLAGVAAQLSGDRNPMEAAASIVSEFLQKELVHVS